MKLREIATIAGKSGLFRIIKPARNGVVVESLDSAKIKSIASVSNRISVLQEISIYTYTAEEAISLKDVLVQIHEEFEGKELPVTPKSDGADLLEFLEMIVPEYDKERVYPSDVKKLVTWYGILLRECPEVLLPEMQESTEDSTAETNVTEANSETENNSTQKNSTEEESK